MRGNTATAATPVAEELERFMDTGTSSPKQARWFVRKMLAECPSVKEALAREGFSMAPANSFWTGQEDRALMELHRSGFDTYAIAESLGRTPSGVRHRLNKISREGGRV